MTKLMLANIDYEPGLMGGGHMSSEGMELQRGLETAGWTLGGRGYREDLADVPALLDRYRPSMVVISDKRDWDPGSGISFRDDVGFERIECLRDRSDIFRIAVIKDAGSMIRYHAKFADEIGADALLTYYHETSVEGQAPWMKKYPQIRTYHSLDRDRIRSIDLSGSRKLGIVSGAVSPVYPLRSLVFLYAQSLGLDTLPHPGYSNHGVKTPEYMETLAGYRVHVATASRYGFALRKIIESVACGATPVTDLPAYDVLPEIDGALFRISPSSTVRGIAEAIRDADLQWNLEERLEWSRRALNFYDYRKIAQRLDRMIETAYAKSGVGHAG